MLMRVTVRVILWLLHMLEEVMGDDRLAEGDRLVIVLGVDKDVLDGLLD